MPNQLISLEAKIDLLTKDEQKTTKSLNTTNLGSGWQLSLSVLSPSRERSLFYWANQRRPSLVPQHPDFDMLAMVATCQLVSYVPVLGLVTAIYGAFCAYVFDLYLSETACWSTRPTTSLYLGLESSISNTIAVPLSGLLLLCHNIQ